MNQDTPSTIKDFIDAAERGRKYARNTAMAYKAAFKLFEAELNGEEKQSVEAFKANLDRIYQEVYNKNKTKYSVGSLDTYRKRISKLLGDYEKYGQDPNKMAGWTPATRKPSVRSGKKQKEDSYDNGSDRDSDGIAGVAADRFEIALSDGRKALIVIPDGKLSEKDKSKVRGAVNLLIGGKNVSEEKPPEA